MLTRAVDALYERLLSLFYRKKYNWAVGNTGFPLSHSFGNHLFEPLFSEDGSAGFWSGVYNEERNSRWYADPHAQQLELLEARRYPKGREIRVRIDEPCLVPCMILKQSRLAKAGGRRLSVSVDGQARDLGHLVSERFYYLAARKPGEASFLCAENDLVIGKPLPTRPRGRRRRLVLNLFIDGWTAETFKLAPLEKAAPNVHRFFSKGTIFDNCYVTSDWSLPGLASLCTGQRVASHELFHPDHDVRLKPEQPLMSELFQRDGYMTFQACGNWRKTPTYGYARGFDRTVYKRQLPLRNVSYAFFDQLRAFPERDTFAWLTYFDLHHMINLLPDVAEQARYTLDGHDYTPSRKKSVLQVEVDKRKTERYLQEISKIDFHLGLIFSYLERNYSDDELLVSLVADHGVGFMTPDLHMLKKERTHTPWMLRGGGVPVCRSSELVQNTDVLPTLLRLSGIDPSALDIDGRVPELLGGPAARDHVICEAVFPGSTYRATIKDLSHEYYFESMSPVDDAGRFDASRFKEELFRADDPSREISSEDHQAVERFARLKRDFLASRARAANHRQTNELADIKAG